FLSPQQYRPYPSPLQQLYIAQAPLNALPPPLQSDLPTLELVKTAGKGDVYNSSVWLGLAPTYTPWHRDPNPNLFCQMVGSKVVRLLPPRLGEHLFHRARAQLGQSTGGSSRIRGEEMMQGEERRVLLEAVWGDSEEGGGVPDEMREVILGPRDMLFIPKGWWHSVKSLGEDGRLNASVNWWFR
ncbi:Clavaminate synthase-like protein, partial [Bombardia bombarda]